MPHGVMRRSQNHRAINLSHFLLGTTAVFPVEFKQDRCARLHHRGRDFYGFLLNLGWSHGGGSLEGDLLFNRSPIGQALTSDAPKRTLGALLVIHAQPDPVAECAYLYATTGK